MIFRLKIPSGKVSLTASKHELSTFWHFFSSNSIPSHSFPNFFEQIRRLEDLHEPRHSVHCDQNA